MSSRFYSFWYGSALAGLMLSVSGCGGGDTQVASAPAPAPSTPPASNPAPSENADASKAQVSYGSEAPSNSGSGNSGSGGGSSGGGSSGGGNSGGGRSMGAIGEATFEDDGGGSGSMMPSSGMMSGGPPALSGGPPPQGAGGGGVGGGNARGSRNPGTGAPMSGGGSGGSYGGESMSSGPMGSGESFGMNNGPDLSMLTTFIQNNCAGCHANGSSKGGVSLDRVGPDLKQDAKLWKSVVLSLEGGSMPPRNARQPDPTRKAAVIELIRQALGGDAGEIADPSFMERAEIAYRKGERENAMSLFYAALVTASDSEATELANHFKFYKPTTKAENLTPANDNGIAVKNKLVTELPLAIGVLLKVQTGITDVKPVGVNQAGGGAGGGASGEGMAGGPMAGGRGGGGGAGGGAGGAMGKLDAFEDLTGEVGQAIVSAYSGRRSSGKFGSLFSSLTQDAPGSFEMGGAMNQGFGSGSGESSEGGLASGMGMGGGPAAPGRGMGGPGMGMGGPGMGMGGDAARPTKTLAGKSLANGLTYIGKADNINALLKKAHEAGVDGLIVVEVEASKPNRMSPIVTNETRFRFMLPSGRVDGASTKTITNTQVEMGKQDSEFIQKQVDAMFAKMDTVLNVIDLPQIPTLAAMKQLHTKIHAGADPLQVLAEARMYQVKGIISTDQLETVYQVVLEGNDGIALAKGSEDDRKLVLTSYTEKL